MAHQYPQAGRCIQQVTMQVWAQQTPTGQSAYSYVNIPNSNKSFSIKETGSLLVVESYTQGWLASSGSGCDSTIYWNSGSEGGVLGRGSSSNGNGWSRSGNGGDSYRSFNNGRIHHIDHGLTAGSTIEIGLSFGAWNTTGATVNYSTSYKSLMGWWCMEFSREGV
tara:strand:+ start:2896 stop:3390 length:495 start_codon:yes stop_codon:yes gene_type:complete